MNGAVESGSFRRVAAVRSISTGRCGGLSFVRPAEYSAAGDDLASLQLVELPMGNFGGVGSLGDMPLAVITHGQPFLGPFFILEKGWSEGQTRLAGLSTNSPCSSGRTTITT